MPSALDYSVIGFGSASTLAPQNSETPMSYSDSSYLWVAADNHNLGNGNASWFDPSTWGERLANAPKFIVSAAVSGVNSFYNTGVAVNNFFGGEAQYRDTAEWLSNIDDDLGEYYKANRESADLVGFIASSFIPGIAGVKVLNAGQKALMAARETGMIGGNIGRAAGLLTPRTDFYIKQAAQEISSSQATFSFLNRSTLRAVASGFGQQALEAAAFEGFVAATMFKSPILDQMDVGDIVKNAAIGAGIGGLLGGVITGASSYYKIKRAVSAADIADKPFTHITELGEAVPVSSRLVQRFEDIANTPAISETDEFLAKHTRQRTDKIQRLQNLIRQDIRTLTRGDDEFANQIADLSMGLDSTQAMNNFLGVEQISRMAVETEAEKAISQYARKIARGKDGKVSALEVAEDTGAAALSKRVSYIKFWGDDAGKITFEHPTVTNLADEVLPGKGETLADAVQRRVAGYKFSEKKLFDVRKSVDQLETEARYIWAERLAKITDGMRIGEHDIPLLERAYKEFAATAKSTDPLTVSRNPFTVNIIREDGTSYSVRNADDLYASLVSSKREAASYLLQRGRANGTGNIDEIAKVTNVRKGFLEGTAVSTDEPADVFARDTFRAQLNQQLRANGVLKQTDPDVDIWARPQWAKIAQDTTPVNDVNGFVVEGMALIKAQQKVAQQAADNAVAAVAGELAEQLPDISDDVINATNRYGAGAGIFSFGNGNYGTPDAIFSFVGAITNRMRRAFKDETTEAINAVGVKLIEKPQAAVEFQTINELVASTAEKYILSPTGDSLVLRSLHDYRAALAAGRKDVKPPKIQEVAPAEIPINNPETAEAIAAHIRINGKRIDQSRTLRAAQGLEDNKDARTFYPVRPDPKDYPYFAFVKDPTITGAGHTKMIHAATQEELTELIRRVPSEYQVITKNQAEDFYRARGEYEYSRTLNENYIDSDLRSRGINSQFFPKTDPQKIVNDWLNDQLRRDDVLAREVITTKYEKQFLELQRLGEAYSDISGSRYPSFLEMVEAGKKNPYLDYMKTALDISRASEYPLLQSMNRFLDSTISKVWNTAESTLAKAKTPGDLEAINETFQRAGFKTAYYDAALELHANHGAPRGHVTSFIRQANALLATTLLRLDVFNAINNKIGSVVLTSSELRGVQRAIAKGDENAVGKLANLMGVAVPGTDDVIRSPVKLYANAISRYFADMRSGSALLNEYKAKGWVTDLLSQHKILMDDLTLTGKESVKDLSTKMQAAIDKAKRLGELGERATGNKFVEEFNRFISADIMKQITDVAVEAGVMSAKEADTYINTFVNRTQGNIIASQRPLAFQGPIGMAIGLFQSYQFNMMQQLFRYIGEGSAKDAATMLGLQGSFYGLNGLPAFNAINTHIIGNASGNPEHRDMYTAIYGLAGQKAGDWILYGAPSNILRANLYTRGDINPRHVTILPTNPADVPFISAYGKFLGQIKDTVSKIAMGGNVWESVLQGLEHNGLSRPLAGLAQVLQAMPDGTVYSTSNKGNVLASNDLLSWSTLARLAGGRPFDEAVATDGVYRLQAYQARDRNRKLQLSEALKTTLIGGNEPSSDQVESFVGAYVSSGGKQKDFAKWMMEQHKSANTPQSIRLAETLRNPYSLQMQELIGGRDLLEGW